MYTVYWTKRPENIAFDELNFACKINIFFFTGNEICSADRPNGKDRVAVV
jgi:hypothetical protein